MNTFGVVVNPRAGLPTTADIRALGVGWVRLGSSRCSATAGDSLHPTRLSDTRRGDNVRPAAPADDLRYPLLSQSERSRETALRETGLGVCDQDLAHDIVRERGVRSPLATRHFRSVALVDLAPLLRHITHVVGLRSSEQMGGIPTGRVVAGMQDPMPLGDGAAMVQPRDNMHEAGRAVNANLTIGQVSVPVGQPRSVPDPALTLDLGMSPKAIKEWDLFGVSSATTRTICTGLIGASLKVPTALAADLRNGDTMLGHQDLPPGEPRAVTAVPGHFAAVIIPEVAT